MLSEFEQRVKEIQAQKQAENKNGDSDGEGDEESRVGLGLGVHYDRDIYGSSGAGKFEGYAMSIAPTEEQEVSALKCNFLFLNYFLLIIRQ